MSRLEFSVSGQPSNQSHHRGIPGETATPYLGMGPLENKDRDPTTSRGIRPCVIAVKFQSRVSAVDNGPNPLEAVLLCTVRKVRAGTDVHLSPLAATICRGP